MQEPLQFGLKNVREMGRSFLAFAAFLYIGIAALIVNLFQSAPPDTAQLIWNNYLGSPISKQVEIATTILLFLLLTPLTFYVCRLQRNARLLVDDKGIRFESRVPFLSKLTDWSLTINDFKEDKVKFTVIALISSWTLPIVALSWGSIWRRRIVRLNGWERLDKKGEPIKILSEQASFSQIPKGFLSWPRRASPDKLQKQFESIPLIEALSQRGVNIPPLSALKRQAFGTDLLSNKRLKHGVYAMLGVSFAATATHFFATHDYLIGQPSWLQVTVFSLTCAVIVWAWLCQGKLDLNLKKSQRYEFFAAQVFVSLVMAVLLTWFAHVMTLGNTRINQAAVNASFILDIDKYQLRPSEQALAAHPGLESIKLDFGKEYWNALPKESIVSIPVRRNSWLRSWQYDREPILDQMREFYLKR